MSLSRARRASVLLGAEELRGLTQEDGRALLDEPIRDDPHGRVGSGARGGVVAAALGPHDQLSQRRRFRLLRGYLGYERPGGLHAALDGLDRAAGFLDREAFQPLAGRPLLREVEYVGGLAGFAAQADDQRGSHIRIGGRAGQAPHRQLYVVADLGTAMRMRQRHRTRHELRDTLNDRIRADHRRNDRHVVPHPHRPIGAPIAQKCLHYSLSSAQEGST